MELEKHRTRAASAHFLCSSVQYLYMEPEIEKTALGATLFLLGVTSLFAYNRSLPEEKEIPWPDFVAEEKVAKFSDVPASFGEWDDEFGCYTTLPRRVTNLSFSSNDGQRRVCRLYCDSCSL